MKDIKNKIKKYIKKISNGSFNNIFTQGTIKLIFWVNVIIAGVLAALTVMTAFNHSSFLGVISILLLPIVFGLYLFVLHIFLEGLTFFQTIQKDIKDITDNSLNSPKRKKVDDYTVKEKED